MKGIQIFGIDNNMRADFFGPQGDDTRWNRKRLEEKYPRYTHVDLDIRNREGIEGCRRFTQILLFMRQPNPAMIFAATRPFDDFDVNAVGTLNLLEASRRHVPGVVFVFMSTNKVYGDSPNEIRLKELPTRWD